MTPLWVEQVPSPLGLITLAATADALVGLEFPPGRSRMLARVRSRLGSVAVEKRGHRSGVAERVRAYLAGDLRALDGIRVDPGGTPFQRRVWSALRKIPAGTTTTYRELAERLGHPRWSRAVGLANARNPVCLVIPCHRVLGSDGDLTGYASGIWRKRWLLEHEGAALPRSASP